MNGRRTDDAGSAAWRALALAALVAGLALRVGWPTRLPDGPWIDEVAAIRAARSLLATESVDPFGTSPILPPEAGFAGAFEPNLYLLFTGAGDRLAGGGMASVRALSLGPSVALFLAGILLAWEVSGSRRRAFAFASILVAGSAWLLRIGRWGWFNLTASALLVLALALALRARRTSRLGPALAAGALLGLSQYGYLASRAGLVFALGAVAVTAVGAVRGRGKAPLRLAAVVFATAGLVALPLFVHLARDGRRATERLQELAPSGGPAALPALFLRNVRDLGGLFFGSGDPNPRHAEPGRPLVPLPVGLAVVAGAVLALRSGGAERVAVLAALTVLATNVATKGGPEAANSFRVVAAAAPLLAVAGLAWDGLARAVERRLPRFGLALAAGLLVAVVAIDAGGFVRWGRSAATDRLFGAPARRLADTLRELGAGTDAEVLVANRAADETTTYVEVLLARPGSAARGVRIEHAGLPVPPPRFGAVPTKDVLYVDVDVDDGGCDRLGERIGAPRVARVPADGGRPPLCVLRLDAGRARAAASEILGRVARYAPTGAGDFIAVESGIYRLEAEGEGGVRSAFVVLVAGRHRSADLVPPGTRLRGAIGPDGFPLRLESLPAR